MGNKKVTSKSLKQSGIPGGPTSEKAENSVSSSLLTVTLTLTSCLPSSNTNERDLLLKAISPKLCPLKTRPRGGDLVCHIDPVAGRHPPSPRDVAFPKCPPPFAGRVG